MPASVIAAVVGSMLSEALVGPIAFGLLDAGLAFGAELVVGRVVGGLVGAMVGNIAGGALKGALYGNDSPSFTAQAQQRTHVLRSSVANRQVIYGRAMVSGPLVFAASSTDNQTLHLVIALAGHECDAVESIWFNDEEVGARDGNGNVTAGTFAGKAQIVAHLGATDQAADASLVAADVGWTSDHRLRGVCYLYVKLTWDQSVYPHGIPNIKAVVRGKKLYDPRTSTTAWSDNFALAVRDYIAGSHGLAATSAEIDDNHFIAAANIADEDVALAGGGTENRYTCNGVVDLGATPRQILEAMLSSGAGVLVWSAGQYRLHAGAYDTPDATALTADDLRGPIAVRPRIARQSLFNAVRGTYVDPAKYWQPGDFPPVSNATYATQDGATIWRDMALPMTTSATTAQRLAKLQLERSRQGITIDFPAKLTQFRRAVWDVVPVTIAQFGWSAKDFRVIDWKFSPDGGVDLVLQEEAAASYSWNSGMQTVIDPAPDTNLPDPFTVAAVTGLTVTLQNITQPDGTIIPRLVAAWNAASDKFVCGYEVAWREDDGPWDGAVVTDTQMVIPAAITGRSYDVRVRAFNTLGVRGAWQQSDNTTADAPAIPPAAPTGTATGAMFSVRLAWTFGDVRTDIRGTEVWWSASNDRASASLLSHAPYPGREYTHPGLAPGEGGYYWLRVIDTFGNISAWYPVSATGGMAGTAISDPADVLDLLQNSLGEDQLAAELAQPIAMIPHHQVDLRRLVESADQAAEAVLGAALKLAEVDSTMSGAGIITNPDTGEVYIYGVIEAERRISSAEVRLDGAEANINLKASVTYVDEAIATAVIDPSQIAALGDIYARLTTAEVDIDGAEAAILLKASQTEVNGIDDRLVVSEGEIDVLQGQIVLKAATTTVNAIDARLNTAETTLNTIDGASIVQTAESIRMLSRDADAAAEAQLAGLLFADREIVSLSTVFASAKNELYAHTNDGLAAEAGARLTLASLVDSNAAFAAAELVNEQNTRAAADTAEANARLALASQVNATAATLTNEQNTRASADTAEANARLALAAQVDTNAATAAAALVTEQNTRASADGANASNIATVQARLNTGDFATVKTTTEANASAISGINAKWGVQVQAMGDGTQALAGLMLMAGTDSESVVAIAADKLLVYKPDGSGVPKQIVTLGNINGATALGVDGNLIIDGSIVARSLATGSVTADKISAGSLSAISANLGNITTGNINIGGHAVINSNGSAYFDNITISRQLSVATSTASGLAGTYGVTPGEGWKLLNTVTVDTGYVVGAWWSASDRTYQASAGINNGSVTLWAYNGNFGTFYANWSVVVKRIYPKSRWWAATTLMLELELWAEVDGQSYQIQFPAPTWAIFKVT